MVQSNQFELINLIDAPLTLHEPNTFSRGPRSPGYPVVPVSAMHTFLTLAAGEGLSGPTANALRSSLSSAADSLRGVEQVGKESAAELLAEAADALALELGRVCLGTLCSGGQDLQFDSALTNLCLNLMSSFPILDYVNNPALLDGVARFVIAYASDVEDLAPFKVQQRNWAILSMVDRLIALKEVPDRVSHIQELTAHLPNIIDVTLGNRVGDLEFAAAQLAIILARKVFEIPEFRTDNFRPRTVFLGRLMEIDESLDRKMEEILGGGEAIALAPQGDANTANVADAIQIVSQLRLELCELVFAMDLKDEFTEIWERRAKKEDTSSAFGHFAFFMIDLCHDDQNIQLRDSHSRLSGLLSKTVLLPMEESNDEISGRDQPHRHFERSAVGVYLWRSFYNTKLVDRFLAVIRLLSQSEKTQVLSLMEDSMSGAIEYFARRQAEREETQVNDRSTSAFTIHTEPYSGELKNYLKKLRRVCVTPSKT